MFVFVFVVVLTFLTFYIKNKVITCFSTLKNINKNKNPLLPTLASFKASSVCKHDTQTQI